MPRNGPASQLSLLSSEILTASGCSQSDGPECPSSTTCDGLWPTPTADSATSRRTNYAQGGLPLAAAISRATAAPSAATSSSSPVGSLANLIPLQESVRRLLTIVTSGPNLPVSFARFARDGSSQRMFPVSSTASLDGSLVRYSGTWPTWGIARDGACGELPTLERCTAANESSSWPTPDTGMGPHGRRGVSTNPNHQSGRSLEALVKMWPTPTSRDHKDGTAKTAGTAPPNGLLGREVHLLPERKPGLFPGSLNPTWVEWLMGFPLGWTALEPSEMPLSRSKPTRSSKRSRSSKE